MNRKLSFFINPKKNSKMTLIKSPMAHKTFSQEQYNYRYYTITLSIKIINNCSYSINEYIYLFLKKLIIVPYKGTNFFFLKKITSNITCSDEKYFNIFKNNN